MGVASYITFLTHLDSYLHAQASGAEFDMVMSTKEQETFETALAARNPFKSIKEELSRVDVRQVRTLPSDCSLPQGPLAVITLATIEGPKPLLSDGRWSAATSRTRTRSCSSWRRAWAPSSATAWSYA